MTKKEILKMTGLSESDFYKKYPTQESFMMEYGGKIAGYESGGKVSYSAKDAAAGKDIGKPGKNFSKIAAEAGERYGSKEAGQRVAGAILAKLRGKRKDGGKITPDEFVKKYYGEKYQSDKDPKTGEDLKGYDYWRNRILSEVDLPLNEDGDIMFESVSDILKRMESANPQGKGFLQVPINQTVVKELMEEQSDLYDTPENVNYNLVKENVKLNAVKNPANPVRPFGWGYDEGSMDGGYKKGGSITPTPTGDIFDMMGMSYLNAYGNGSYTRGNNPTPYLSLTSTQMPYSQSFVEGLPLGSDVSNLTTGRYGIQGGMPLGAGKGVYLTGEAGVERGLSRDVATKTVNPYGQVSNFSMTPWEETNKPYGSLGLNFQNPEKQYYKGLTGNQSSAGFGVSYGNDMISPYADVNPRLAVNFGSPRRGNQPLTAAVGVDARLRPFYEKKYEENSWNEANSGASYATPYLGASGRLGGGLEVGAKGGYNLMTDKPQYGISVTKKFQQGGDIDVKAPLYDETELNTNINTNLYASGSYTPMYAGGSYIPMYGFGNWVKDVGKLTLNNLAAPLEHVSGNNFVNFDYDNKAMADAAAVSEGLSGAATDIVGTTFLGPAYGMAKGQVQGVTRNLGSSSEEQKGASKAANQIGQIAGSTGDLISGISSGNVQQIVGGAGNVLGTTGQQLGSQELGAVGQLTGTASQFVGSGKSTPSTTGMGPMGDMVSPQNAMGFFAKNGGNVPAYMQNMRKFAQGGMTVGNVEGKELLIDPYKLEAGGVPKILADYTNIPRHPSDGSIDERGTVPLPVNKYVITNAMREKFKKSKQSNDGLWSSAIMNKIDFDKNKKEQQEMQKASNAYGRFMAKYGGTIEKMYACGGKTYGCGGMTKYDDGGGTPSYPLNMTGPRDILPLMFTDPYVVPVNNNIGLTSSMIGSSLPQGGLQLSLPSSGAPALPADWNSGMRSGVLTEPRLNTPAMGSSLPQGWQLQNPSADDGWKLDANLSPARVDLFDGPMTLMEPLGPTGSQAPRGPVGDSARKTEMVSRRDPSDYLGQQYGMNPSVLGQIAPMLPALGLGLEAALSKPYQVKASDYMVNERLKPEKISPNYRPIYEAENRAAYDIAQMAPGSGGYLAGRTALNANTKKVIADYKKALEDEYVKQKLGADQFNITKDLQNAQTKLAVDQFNEQNRAARRNAMREQFGKNLPAAFFNQQYNNMGMQAIQAQYPNQQFNWGIFGKSKPV